MPYKFVDSDKNEYETAYLDATVLGGEFFHGYFLTVTSGRYLTIEIDEEHKEGFLGFNEEYWIQMAEHYIQNDIDYVTFVAEPDVDSENELYLVEIP